MKKIKSAFLLTVVLLIASCGDDGTGFNFQSDECNDGDQATLVLNVSGVGSFTFSESSSAVSHATDTEGGGVDAIVFYFRWVDPVSGDSLLFDITVENEELDVTTYNYDAGNFNGTVNFYIYKNGLEDAHFIFTNWSTTVDEFDVYRTTTGGGFTNTKLAFVRGSTSGTFTKVGVATTHTFTSSYTICPRY